MLFCHCYDEYAVKAFESGAVDYLLKPIDWERLTTSISRLKSRLAEDVPPDLSKLIQALQQHEKQSIDQHIRWITASAGDTTKVLSIDEVLGFIADNKYTRVITHSDEAFIRTPIKDLINSLDANTFWQIHRGSVVRVSAINKVLRNELGKLELELKGTEEIFNVSDTYKYRFKSM